MQLQDSSAGQNRCTKSVLNKSEERGHYLRRNTLQGLDIDVGIPARDDSVNAVHEFCRWSFVSCRRLPDSFSCVALRLPRVHTIPQQCQWGTPRAPPICSSGSLYRLASKDLLQFFWRQEIIQIVILVTYRVKLSSLATQSDPTKHSSKSRMFCLNWSLFAL